jgi:hypothetical protein
MGGAIAGDSAADTKETITDIRGNEFPVTVPEPVELTCPECGGNAIMARSASAPTGVPAASVLYAPVRCTKTRPEDCGWTGHVTFALASVSDDDPPTRPERGLERDDADEDELGRGAGLFDEPRSQHSIDDLDNEADDQDRTDSAGGDSA